MPLPRAFWRRQNLAPAFGQVPDRAGAGEAARRDEPPPERVAGVIECGLRGLVWVGCDGFGRFDKLRHCAR